MSEPVKRYQVFVNGTAFMGMLKRRDDEVYGPEYAPDSFTDFCIFSDHERAMAEKEAELATLTEERNGWRRMVEQGTVHEIAALKARCEGMREAFRIAIDAEHPEGIKQHKCVTITCEGKPREPTRPEEFEFEQGVMAMAYEVHCILEKYAALSSLPVGGLVERVEIAKRLETMIEEEKVMGCYLRGCPSVERAIEYIRSDVIGGTR